MLPLIEPCLVIVHSALAAGIDPPALSSVQFVWKLNGRGDQCTRGHRSAGLSAAEDIAPPIKYVAMPYDPPFSVVHCVLPEIVRTFPVPGNNTVVHCIVQNGGLSGIEILHRM